MQSDWCYLFLVEGYKFLMLEWERGGLTRLSSDEKQGIYFAWPKRERTINVDEKKCALKYNN